jgi:hypothetical protein
MADGDRDWEDVLAGKSVVYVEDVLDSLDSRGLRLPEDHPDYPMLLRLVFFELFSKLRQAAELRREAKHRPAAIGAVRAISQFLARFEGDTTMTTSFLSLESALLALDKGVVEPLLEHTRSPGRGWNSMDREFVIGAAVITVQHLRWAGLTASQAHSAVAHTLHKAGFRAGRGSRPVEPRTVRHWCAQVAEDVGRHTLLARFVNEILLDEDRTAIQARRPQIAQKHAIWVLESFVKRRCSAVLRKDS